MRDENKKYYNKALDLYNKGEIDKALEVCEKGISLDLKNSNLLNLKGLLLYLKGDLNGAVAAWKINKDYNNDSIAKTYLNDSYKDESREKLFKEAERLVNNLAINEAIERLLICSESDFNMIKVNNLLALCYLRKGDYDNSKLYLNKVLSIDKNNSTAKKIYKEINEFLEVKSNTKIFVPLLLLIFIITAITISYKSGLINKIINREKNELIYEDKSKTENKEEEENNREIKENNKAAEENNKEESDNLKEENKVTPLTNEEIQSNYEKASTYFEEENYKASKDLLIITLNSAENNHLHDDILFLLASSYDRLNEVEYAIKYFDEYLLKYDYGNYSQEAYYRMALIYKDIDINKSKKYAKELADKYPKSIYNNQNINTILNS
ncbi:tetratricopeptide repeat protein [Clostridium isatidis]|uniref:Tetratricopeptide repeat protein n=1 Tax=Clostridium isatidis TaxID=182773 RepID=A0A343J9J1_9CLOT|nr:tetratricopeptide repeat protein [Clostridium isatidis]ASW42199.1 hypothetical protein BEN51_01440 [Clostridium isatidis]NLZ34480.1 tetratricopeptide repeat protein [Clostridiales bacterium]